MKTLRRVSITIGGILILASSTTPWFGNIIPANILFDNFVNKIIIPVFSSQTNITLLGSTSMEIAIFVLGAIIILSAALNTRLTALIASLIMLIIIVFWSLSAGITLQNILNWNQSNYGSYLAISGIVVTILSVILPSKKSLKGLDRK